MRHSIFILSLTAICFFSSCKKDDPIIPNQEEVITTLIYTLTKASGESAELKFIDSDGDGGIAPIVTSDFLSANTVYLGSLQILNEIVDPTEDITTEIEEEGTDHQFFFQPTLTDTDIIYNDQDSDGNPIGLNTIFTTGNAGDGQLTVTLKHEPIKSANGVMNGDITNAGGETDIEVTFVLDVR